MAIDPRKYGPTRGELKLRIGIATAILALMGIAVAVGGVPTGPAMVELGLFGGTFLIGSIIWAARRLVKGLHP